MKAVITFPYFFALFWSKFWPFWKVVFADWLIVSNLIRSSSDEYLVVSRFNLKSLEWKYAYFRFKLI